MNNWNDHENLSFDLRVHSERFIDANVVTPDSCIITLEGNGEVTDFGSQRALS